MGNTHEAQLNSKLAHFLRTRGLEAQTEQQVIAAHTGKRYRADILVELEDRTVAIDAEFHSGSNVQRESGGFLAEPPLFWRGLRVQDVFKLVYPSSIMQLPASEALAALQDSGNLRIARGARRGDSIAWDSWERGSAVALAETLHDHWVCTSQVSDVDAVVGRATDAINVASEFLERLPEFSESGEDSDLTATAPLIWLNAMLFQQLLATDLLVARVPGRDRAVRIPRLGAQAKPSDLINQ